MIDVPHDVTSDKAKRELGWQPRPLSESVLDTAELLISQGVIQPPKPRR
jgi:hypothetical protein